jgi:hypothetical protein
MISTRLTERFAGVYRRRHSFYLLRACAKVTRGWLRTCAGEVQRWAKERWSPESRVGKFAQAMMPLMHLPAELMAA